MLLLRKNRLKRRHQKYKITNFRKFQRKNPTKKGYDVNLGAKCFECFINSQKEWGNSANEKK
jgi:hypothetical protein